MSDAKMIPATIHVVYRLEHIKTEEVIEPTTEAQYATFFSAQAQPDSILVEALARKYIATDLVHCANAGDVRFAYDAPAPWVEITSLGVALDGGHIKWFEPTKLLTPKQLAMMYQRRTLRAYWDEIGLDYRKEVKDIQAGY
jgi:hypothetical protein